MKCFIVIMTCFLDSALAGLCVLVNTDKAY